MRFPAETTSATLRNVEVLEMSELLQHRTLRLQTHLALLLVSVTIPLLFVLALLLWRSADLQRQQLESHIQVLADDVAADIDRDLERRIAMLETLATSPALAARDWQAFHAQASAAAQGRSNGVFVVDAMNFQQIVDTVVPFGSPLPTTGVPDLVERVRANSSPQVSDYYVGLVSKKPTYDVAVPIARDGIVRYVLLLGLDPNQLTPIVRPPSRDRAWSATVSDRNNVVLASTDDHERLLGTVLPVPPRDKELPARGVRTTTDDTATQVLRGIATTRTGWRVSVRVPASFAAAPLQRSFVLWSGVALGGLLLALIPAVAAGRNFSRGVAALQDGASSIADGNPPAPFPPSRILEIKHMAAFLDETSRSLVQKSRALQESEARAQAEAAKLQALLDHAPVAIWTADSADCRIIRGNAMGDRLLGVGSGRNVSGTPPLYELRRDGRPLQREDLPMQRAGRTGHVVTDRIDVRIAGGKSIKLAGTAVPLKGSDGKVQGVIAAFVDVTELTRAEERSRSREALLRSIAETTRVGFYMIGKDGRFSYANPAYLETIGLEPRDITGSPVVDVIGQERFAKVLPYHQRVLAGEVVSFEREGAVPGATRPHAPWRLVHLQPFHDETGDVTGIVGVVVDITERKRTEAHQKLMLNELNHRVRNTLGVVQSIARQTARATPDPATFVTLFSGRVDALARAHTILTSRDWQDAALDEAASAVLTPFVVDSKRLHMSGTPGINLPSTIIVSLSLLLHELATNATRYGALSGADGTVAVDWRVENERVTLEWVETGGPAIAEAPVKAGFGIRLLRASAEQMDAECVAEYPPEGARVRIALPLGVRS